MPTRCRAAVQFERGGPLLVSHVEVADPGPGEVLIRLSATGLCHTDMHMMEAEQPPIAFALPAIHGHEAIGTVVAAGEGAQAAVGDVVMPYVLPDCGVCPFCRSGRTNMCVEFARGMMPGAKSYVSIDGQPVASVGGMGTFCEYLCIRDDQVVPVNPATKPVPGCCIPCAVTTGVASATIDAQIYAGASVVVFGAGGVGLNVIQGARLRDAGLIVAVDINRGKESAARLAGATHFLDPTTADVASQVRQWTGIGADFAFDTVGSIAVFRQALASLHDGGYARLIRIAVDTDPQSNVHLGELGGKRFSSTLMGGAKRRDVARFADWFVEGKLNLDDLVSHRLPLERINEGFDLMRSGQSLRTVVTF